MTFRNDIANAELARNIRRNVKLILEELDSDDKNSNLIDLANHIDAIAQQIEYTCDNL